MDEPKNFHAAAPKTSPRILCIGMPVRDLTFRIEELPERGLKVNASHFEEIAGGKPGVEKVFAMQAGREIRVMVKPDRIDDIQAQVIARDIAKQVEEELTYPGQIRITVVRESRATEFAR